MKSAIEQQAFEDGFFCGAKMVDMMLDIIFDLSGVNNLGLPPINLEIEGAKTFCAGLYAKGGKDAVLAHFNKKLEALKNEHS